ncbi:hypothetical protein KTAU_39660 [Thermogemmatispora aurantia]|uniref:Uncharacterized protein n=1 Tax=Thermogemmatispora aurantia TaxID=2045279 RepID=A0A5J4KGC9_9CHLR|nr:hypothetical protein [Thermogemmatispora aurantia]GER85331.1 hypothetical protein KTAU_39660 [Thermogemmatispora aurantia]
MSNQLQLQQATEQDEIINEVCNLASKLASVFHEPPCYWTAAMLRKCYQQSYAAFSESQRSPWEQRRRWWVLHYADMALYAFCCRAEGSIEELEDFQDVTQSLNRTHGYRITLRQAANAAIARHSLYLRGSLPSREESRRAVLEALQIEA